MKMIFKTNELKDLIQKKWLYGICKGYVSIETI